MTTHGIVFGTCLIIFSCLVSIGGQRYDGLPCTTQRARPGICRTYAHCPQATRDVKKGLRPKICGFIGKESFVCCPDEVVPPESRRVSENMCWRYSSHVYTTSQVPTLLPEPEIVNDTDCSQSGQELVIGGVAAGPKEFPHMVNLGYGPEDSISWLCGASLISERWLLTAAHCIADRAGPVQWARLGDLVIDSDEDSARPQTIRIVERVAHPNYKRPALYNDIALLKLEKDAVLSSWVRPACLDTDRRTVPKDKATATGWGITNHESHSTSKVLMKVTLPFRTAAKCNETYRYLAQISRNFVKGFDEDTMICAGDARAGRDTCAGDSGGPLQKKLKKPTCMYSVVGVTSFGAKACGLGDNPSVYTRVSRYLSWIEGVVWPDEV